MYVNINESLHVDIREYVDDKLLIKCGQKRLLACNLHINESIYVDKN